MLWTPRTPNDALLDDSKTYRYVLQRTLRPSLNKKILWIMLNPSTADHTVDDPTIRKCKQFSDNWGFGVMRVANLFALRSSDPKRLFDSEMTLALRVGPDNDLHLREQAEWADQIIFAWGQTLANKWMNRDVKVMRIIRETRMFYQPPGLYRIGNPTEKGHPKHPLYLSYAQGRQEMEFTPLCPRCRDTGHYEAPGDFAPIQNFYCQDERHRCVAGKRLKEIESKPSSPGSG